MSSSRCHKHAQFDVAVVALGCIRYVRCVSRRLGWGPPVVTFWKRGVCRSKRLRGMAVHRSSFCFRGELHDVTICHRRSVPYSPRGWWAFAHFAFAAQTARHDDDHRRTSMSPLLEVKDLTLRRDDGSGLAVLSVRYRVPLSALLTRAAPQPDSERRRGRDHSGRERLRVGSTADLPGTLLTVGV